MTALIDLTGQRFGLLTVLDRVTSKGGARWRCACDCGGVAQVQANHLRAGAIDSCGCQTKARRGASLSRHGMSKTPTYVSWLHMRDRCFNPQSPSYPDYGGRGIKVCERWSGFELFLADMGMKPDRMTIERKNNDGDYSPENCEWATRKKQNNNRRSTVFFEIDGRRQSVTQWAEERGLKPRLVWCRIYSGWSIPKALGLS